MQRTLFSKGSCIALCNPNRLSFLGANFSKTQKRILSSQSKGICALLKERPAPACTSSLKQSIHEISRDRRFLNAIADRREEQQGRDSIPGSRFAIGLSLGLILVSLELDEFLTVRTEGLKKSVVMAWGGGLSGALGTGDTRNDPTPKKIEHLPEDVVGITCGDSWSACITEAGQLYTWGKGQDGRLGHGDTSDVYSPSRVDIDEEIVQISAGISHGGAVSRSGNVWMWGRGVAGQLGFGDSKSCWSPKPVDLQEYTPSKVECGGSHTMIVTTSGGLLAFGRGSEGQLGLGEKANSAIPVGVPAQNVKDVACGKDFSLIVLQDGRLLTCGADDYGQLGLGKHSRYALKPTEVRALSQEHVVKVAAGDYHSAAVTSDGRLYMWGYGRAGQLGLGGTVDLSIPTLVNFKNERVVDVRLGRDHSLAILEGGAVYMWGRGRDGQLGRGAELESPTAFRSSPLKVETLGIKKLKVQSAGCGAFHTIVLAHPA